LKDNNTHTIFWRLDTRKAQRARHIGLGDTGIWLLVCNVQKESCKVGLAIRDELVVVATLDLFVGVSENSQGFLVRLALHTPPISVSLTL